MLFLFKLWIFEIDLTVLLSFIVGIAIGMIILCLVYALLVVLSLRDKKYAAKLEANDLSANEAKEMIEIAKDAFKSKDLRGDMSKTTHFIQVGKDLVYGIASRFYPNSKYPLAELTIDECLDLIGYVQLRLSELLNRKGLRLLKKYKVSQILVLTRATTAVVDSKTFEVTKEVSKAISIGKKIINVINPMWWGKKIITDVAIGIIMNKLYLAVLSIIGEEAYKIYSKSYKNYAEDIDTGVEALVDEIDKDIKDELKKDDPTLFKGEDTKKESLNTEYPLKAHSLIVKGGLRSRENIYDEARPMKNKKEPLPELAAPVMEVKQLGAPED